MMGSETEFGIFGGWTLEKAESVQRVVLECHPHLTGVKRGAFLLNGGRVYVDQDKQNEYSTPETSSPEQLVIHELAGRKLMETCAAHVNLTLLVSNFDPSSGSAWGNHENYECCHSFNSDQMNRLYAHLVSRIVYTGAGGIHPNYPGVCPVLSLRAARTSASCCAQGVRRKSLVYIKPESYCSGHRLHLICGESLLSHWASYLKYATTALVVQCLDAGCPIGPGLFAESPIQVFRKANRDLSFSAKHPMLDGRKLSILEIQQAILDDVQTHMDILPEWAAVTIDRWDEVLDALKHEKPMLDGRLDWKVYVRALHKLTSEYGLEARDVQRLNQTVLHENARKRSGPVMEKFKEYRAAANELYVRLHLLSKESLFAQMEKQGFLDHQLPEMTDQAIQEAIHTPPAGRAAWRSALVRKYGGLGGYRVDWEYLWDAVNRRRMPIHENTGVTVGESGEFVSARTSDSHIEIAQAYFRVGRYPDAIRQLNLMGFAKSALKSQDFGETCCLSYARLGMKLETMASLEKFAGCCRNRFEHVAISLFCLINLGMSAPLDEMAPLIDEADKILAAANDMVRIDDYHVFVFRQNKARVLTLQGFCDDAAQQFRSMLALPANQGRPRMLARTRCYHAEALRLLGRTREAQEELSRAKTAHRDGDFAGDMAAHSLPLQAKLGCEAEAAEALRAAESILRRQENKIGLARILCLKARRLKTNADYAEICQLRNQVSALQDCHVAARIVTNGEAWVHGSTGPEPDDYWGV